MKSWKTTLAGISAIVAALASVGASIANGQPVDYTTAVAAVMAGIGLIVAKDSNVSGGTVKQ